MAYKGILYIGLIVLISAGLVSGLRLSFQNFSGLTRCPHLGPLALCYLVTLGYSAMLLGTLLTKAHSGRILFRSGWIVVFLLAFTGAAFELTVGDVCPRSDGGIPLCYASLALSVTIGLVHALIYREQIADGSLG